MTIKNVVKPSVLVLFEYMEELIAEKPYVCRQFGKAYI